MMQGTRNRSVNVSRVAMLEALKINLAAHKAEFEEAHRDYLAALKVKLDIAQVELAKGNTTAAYIKIVAPVDHSEDYEEVIEMMEMSVDETINLDADAFRAYFKNAWSWKSSFDTASGMYKSILAGASV